MPLERLARLIQPHLNRVRESPGLSTWPTAVEMSQDVLVVTLTSEAEFWQKAAQMPGLTPHQRHMRLEVSRFYREALVKQQQAMGGGP